MTQCERDEERLDYLYKKFPEWKTWSDDLKRQIKKDAGEFFLAVGDDWRKRQMAHLIAHDMGWYTKSETWASYDFLRFVSFIGIYGFGEEDYDEEWGWVTKRTGDMLFSPTPVKLGKVTKKRRNAWRTGRRTDHE